MTVAQQRLRAQRLAGTAFATPADVVSWFGAVQAQDYAGALWALGLRTTGATEASVEQALVDRSIVRTWPLRGTLHFAAAADVRWMLRVFGAQTIARNARRFRQFGLDQQVFNRCTAVTIKALEGGRQLSRPQLYARFEKAGVKTGGMRGLHIVWKLAHDGLICFGARDGKQQTFVLLEEWLPRSRTLDRDEALAELARRYFTSHGPATLQDFTWWSGLVAADARRAVEAAAVGAPHLASSHGARRTSARPPAPRPSRPAAVVLLPPYDEYTVAYLDRSAALDPRHAAASRNGICPTLVIHGRIAGTWTRRLERDAVTIALKPFTRLTGAHARGIAAAAVRYGRFLGRPARLV